MYTFCFYHASGNLIPVKLLSGSKGPFWESHFLCVYTLLLPYLLKFDSRKAAFRLERAFLGIKFYKCIILYNCVCTLLLPYLLEFDSVLVGMVPSVLPTSSEPQQQMFTDTEKNNDINISCARPCAFLRLPGKTHYKFTTTYSNHTFV